MKNIDIKNPFNAPVYHEETVSSTMDVSRSLASKNAAHGTVIIADFQEAGRGRIHDRIWEMERNTNLALTIILRFPKMEKIPIGLTLRVGLAVSLAIEDFSPSLKNSVMVKWPNDIMINSKKTAGILCEADGGIVHLGIGINVKQKEFPDHLKNKATSIYKEQVAGSSEQVTGNREQRAENSEQGAGNREQIAGSSEQLADNNDRFLLLEMILTHLYNELEIDLGKNWKSRLENRLYKKNDRVTFIEGAAGSEKIVNGKLIGIGENGEILILPEGKKEFCSFFSGELKY